MRFGLLLLIFVSAFHGAASANTDALLTTALDSFRPEGAKGWSFTQTTRGDGHSRVERYDAAQPDFNRWTLLREDNHAPTPDEIRDYQEKLSRRSRGGTAPRLADQLDRAAVTVVSDDGERVVYRGKLKEGEAGDATARFLEATLTIHRPTATLEKFEIASTGPFSPVFGVKIAEMKTTMQYSLPADERPSLLLNSTTRLRGRAFYFKSLDADMTVTFTDHQPVRRPKK